MGILTYIYFWKCFLVVFQHNKVGALQKAITVFKKKYEQLNTVDSSLFVGFNVLKSRGLLPHPIPTTRNLHPQMHIRK